MSESIARRVGGLTLRPVWLLGSEEYLPAVFEQENTFYSRRVLMCRTLEENTS